MSAVIKTRRGKPNTWSTAGMWLVIGLAVVFFLVIYGQQLLLEHSLKEKIAVQRQENARTQDENTRLKAGLLYYQSDKYIEQRAREDLNLRREDEHVLVPVSVAPGSGDQAVADHQPSASVSEAPAPQQEQPNWLKWFDLFKPPGSAP